MRIEYIFNSVTIQPDQIQEYFPALAMMINSSMPKQKTPKRRKPRKKKQIIGPLIQDIIDSIDK